MYIEDTELREIYRATSTEHLQKLEQGLIHLEKSPNDRSILEEFLREAHTLKGDSRMLGVQEVESLMHQIEECLAPIKQGEAKITSELCDRLYHGVDAIKKIVREAITGEACGVDVLAVLAILTGGKSSIPTAIETAQSSPSTDLLAKFQAFTNNFHLFEETSAKEDDIFASDSLPSILENQVESKIGEEEPKTITTDYQIETIRVEPQKLDILMAQISELNAVKLKLANHMKEVGEVMALWEEWSRDAASYRIYLQNKASNSKLEAKEGLEEFDRRFNNRFQQLGLLLSQIQARTNEDTANLEIIVDRLESGVTNLRLLPLATIFNLFPRMVRDLARQQGKEVEFLIEGGEIMADKRVLEEIKDPLMHLLRNAIDHGIEMPAERLSAGKTAKATVHLIATQTTGGISIEVIDDGRGLDLEAIKATACRKNLRTQTELESMSEEEIQNLIFASGFSTRTTVTEISGRGIGMDVVRANVERLKGSIIVSSQQGNGCHFLLKFSNFVSTTQVLIVEVQKRSYAIPLESIDCLMLLSPKEIFALQGKQSIVIDNNPIPIAWLSDILGLPANIPDAVNMADLERKNLSCLILYNGLNRLALLVDALIDQQNIVVKPPNKLLQQVPNLRGMTILGTGEICLVLNPQDLLVASHTASSRARLIDREAREQRSLLLVEDSLVIRTQMKRILEGAGYDVTVAIDGLDGLEKLRSNSIDLIVSDVEMPNLSGLELTAKIREYSEYSELPIILVTTLAKDEDKRRGAEAGANAYLTKGDFDQKLLLEAIERLI
jgi:two-component system, chemotaxis family, sensor kinase CheA